MDFYQVWNGRKGVEGDLEAEELIVGFVIITSCERYMVKSIAKLLFISKVKSENNNFKDSLQFGKFDSLRRK